MTTKDFKMGFFGRNPFDKDARKKFQEEWSKMTDDEKLEMMNKRMEDMGKDHFSVEAIDALCEEWMKMSAEEKEQFVKERKEAFEERCACRGGFHGHGFHGNGFHGHGFFGRDFSTNQDQ